MTLPGFLVIGAQKSGTTSLYRYLQGHPEVHLPDWKEPGFFVEEQAWSRGLAWYEGLFAGAGDAVVGEASTSYTMFPYFDGVPERIRTVVPDVRLIYVLREPVARMRSAYVHALSSGVESRPIRQALLESATFLSVSQYALQLERYLEHFPRSQVLLVLSSALDEQRAATLHQVFDFIGVSGWTPPDVDVRYHRSVAKRVPRTHARIAGGLMVRTMQALGRYEPSPRQVRLPSRFLTRAVRPDETVVDADLRRRLVGMLAPDVRRLRALAAPDFDPAALDAWGIG